MTSPLCQPACTLHPCMHVTSLHAHYNPSMHAPTLLLSAWLWQSVAMCTPSPTLLIWDLQTMCRRLRRHLLHLHLHPLLLLLPLASRLQADAGAPRAAGLQQSASRH